MEQIEKGIGRWFSIMVKIRQEQGNGCTELRRKWFLLVKVYRSIKSTGILAESRGERYYICVIGQISLACKGKKVISSAGLANGESEGGGWGSVSQQCPF